MFDTIRKHQKWLWFGIIGIMILTMVIWTNQGGGNNHGGSGNFGSIDDKAINATEMHHAEKDVMLMYLTQTHPHQWPQVSDSELQRQIYQQLFILRKLDEYNIHADPDAAARAANSIMSDWDQGQPISIDDLVKIINSKGLTKEDLEHYLENEVAFKQLEAVVGLGGKVVTPDEIKTLYAQNYQELAVEAVFFSASNSLAKIPAPTPDALGQYYTNEQAKYRLPDEIQLSYVYFNVTNFVPQAERAIGTNINSEVNQALASIGTNSIRYGKTEQEARAKVRELILLQTAQTNAESAALAFEKEVEAAGTNKLENLSTVAKSKGLEVNVTKPFDKEYGPGEIHLAGNFPVASFFDLTPDDSLMPSPLPGMDGVYIAALNKVIPSHIPTLSEIHTRVEDDYRFGQALRIAQLNGQSFAQTATNELAHGKTFAQTCETTRVKPVQLPPFSRATPRLPEVEEQTDLNEFKQTAFTTPIGGVSRFVESPEGGFVVHVKQRLPVDDTQMAKQLPEFSDLVRQRRQSEAFNIWFSEGWSQEINRGLKDVASLRQQPQQ